MGTPLRHCDSHCARQPLGSTYRRSLIALRNAKRIALVAGSAASVGGCRPHDRRRSSSPPSSSTGLATLRATGSTATLQSWVQVVGPSCPLRTDAVGIAGGVTREQAPSAASRGGDANAISGQLKPPIRATPEHVHGRTSEEHGQTGPRASRSHHRGGHRWVHGLACPLIGCVRCGRCHCG